MVVGFGMKVDKVCISGSPRVDGDDDEDDGGNDDMIDLEDLLGGIQ